MRAVLPAAGIGQRFRHYHKQREQFEREGFTKHFLDVCGETIIGRLVRQLNDRNITDVWVVGPDARYDIPGSQLFVPTQVPEHYDSNKILNSSELWEGRTLILYGDVYMTDEGLDAVVADERDWFAFGRWGSNRYTGTPSELFGFVFTPDHFDAARRTLLENARLVRARTMPRAAGWELYWGLLGDPNKWRIDRNTWLQVDDMSDDVDTPAQYEGLLEALGCSGQSS